jgi:DNA-binding response OmpR family regulator
MTTSDDGVMREAALALGARRVLRKPFRPQELLRSLRATLAESAQAA